MFRVGDIADFLYCPRKFYLNKKFGFELFERDISDKSIQLIKDLKASIDSPETNFVNIETQKIVKCLSGKNNLSSKLFGDKANVKVSFGKFFKSNYLSGRVDELIKLGPFLVPVKFKFSCYSPTKETLWEADKLEAIAYAHLVKSNLKKLDFYVYKSYLFFINSGRVFQINFNSPAESQLKNVLLSMRRTLDSSVPRINTNYRKCDSCSIKKKCYSFRLFKS